jgi:hypothetical protein
MTTPLSYFLDDDDKRRHDFAAWAVGRGFAGAGDASDWCGDICMGMWEAYKAGRDFEASKNAELITLPVLDTPDWYTVNEVSKGKM